MDIYQDGVPVYVLPDVAVCKADAEKRNPLDIDVCPMGYDVCIGGCEKYDEELEKREGNS